MTIRPPRTWAQTTCYAEAMEDIIELIGGYLPPDSGISHEAVVSEVISIIEEKAGHQVYQARFRFCRTRPARRRDPALSGRDFKGAKRFGRRANILSPALEPLFIRLFWRAPEPGYARL